MSTKKIAAKKYPDKSQSSLAEGVEKELTCAICLSRLNQPKVLPCLHSYCVKCLANVLEKAKDKKNLTCPQCQETHEVPAKGIDGFKTHFTYNNLLELLHIHEVTGGHSDQAKVIPCESGLDENPSVARCLTCEDYLCQGCYDLHIKLKASRNHTVALLEEIKTSSKESGIKSIRKKKYCEEHKEEVLKLFCKTCQSVICRDCILVKYRDHDYVFVEEVRQDAQKKLEELMVAIQEKEKGIRAHSERMKQVQEQNVKNLDKVEREIKEEFERVINILKEREAKLLSDLHHEHEQADKLIQAEADSLGLTLLRIADSLRFTQQLLNNGDDVEVLAMSGQAQQTLESLTKVKHGKDAVKPIRLITKFSNQTREALKTFGTVCSPSGQEDIMLHNYPKELKKNQEHVFAAKLTPRVKGPLPAAACSISISHEDCVGVKKSSETSWRISFTPRVTGKYKMVVQIGNFSPLAQTLQVRNEYGYLTRNNFDSDKLYGEYVKATLKPEMRIRAREAYAEVLKGDCGTFLNQRSKAGKPPAQLLWDMLGKTCWMYWHQVEIVSD